MPRISESLSDILPEMPMVLPVPKDLPPEIPLVQYPMSNTKYGCNLARSRADLFLSDEIEEDAHTKLSSFFEKQRLFLEVVSSFVGLSRFGLIGRYFIETDSPTVKIVSRYFKDNMSDLEEISLRYNLGGDFQKIKLNNVIEIAAGSSISPIGEHKKGVLVQKDLNNKPEGKISPEDILSVIEFYKKHFSFNEVRGLV
jgi:hypothetical protein